MSFISFFFVHFFIITVLIYYLLPNKFRNLFLLGASYYAYFRWNNTFVLLLIYVTLISFLGGLVIQKKKNKATLGAFICLTITPLLFYKYLNFLVESLNDILILGGGNSIEMKWNFMLPVGISFFTFQALSYLVDVYRQDVLIERNIIKYALFISFFPQLVAGPIEKSKNFLNQFDETHNFKEENVTLGFIQILGGFFLKVMIADRVAIIVDTIFGNVNTYVGFYLVIGACLFLVQIYCDFCGYSIIAVGAARALGFRLTDNFEAPFFSISVAEFWRRWHISLSTWFKEYLYFPLGGNRKGKTRKYINLLIVFGVSGLWHGASWGFFIWGILNAFYQICGELLSLPRQIVRRILRVNTKSLGYKIFSAVATFMLVAFSFIFFRTRTITEGIVYVKRMFMEWNPWVLLDGSLFSTGIRRQEWTLLAILLMILMVVDLMKYRHKSLSLLLLEQDIIVRYMIYAILIIGMIIFASYGEDSSNFIYFAF